MRTFYSTNNWWAWKELNFRPIGYASHYYFRNLFRVCELDYPFIRRGGVYRLVSTPFPNTRDLARDHHNRLYKDEIRLPRI